MNNRPQDSRENERQKSDQQQKEQRLTRLTDYIFGQLDDSERDQLEREFESSAELRREQAELQRVVQALSGRVAPSGLPAPSTELREAVERRLARGGKPASGELTADGSGSGKPVAGSPVADRPGRSRNAVVWLALATAACLLLMTVPSWVRQQQLADALRDPSSPAIIALPGQEGALPGQEGALPGQEGALPGQEGALPGQEGASPGQEGASPGQEGASHGQEGKDAEEGLRKSPFEESGGGMAQDVASSADGSGLSDGQKNEYENAVESIPGVAEVSDPALPNSGVLEAGLADPNSTNASSTDAFVVDESTGFDGRVSGLGRDAGIADQANSTGAMWGGGVGDAGASELGERVRPITAESQEAAEVDVVEKAEAVPFVEETNRTLGEGRSGRWRQGQETLSQHNESIKESMVGQGRLVESDSTSDFGLDQSRPMPAKALDATVRRWSTLRGATQPSGTGGGNGIAGGAGAGGGVTDRPITGRPVAGGRLSVSRSVAAPVANSRGVDHFYTLPAQQPAYPAPTVQPQAEGWRYVPNQQLSEERITELGVSDPLHQRGGRRGFGLEDTRSGRTKRKREHETERPTNVTRANNEQYEPIVENQFLSANDNPLSTFGIDVDTASYANVRRFLTQGRLPPPAAVRIEELINYFQYGELVPDKNDPFAVSLEVADCPWNRNHQLLRIALKGKRVHREERPASNLVFLLDVSGSMSDANKLPLLKQAMKLLVDQLTENDRVAIVTYAGEAGLQLDSTTGDQKGKIRRAIDSLNASGSTNGSAGIELAYQKAAERFIEEGTNRVLLATDGDLNVGITTNHDLVRMIQDKAQSGVFLTVLGFGEGNLKDAKLEQLADNGNGLYAYLDNLREARKVLVEQMTGNLVTIAKDVKIQVEFNPAEVQSYRLIGYENRVMATRDFDNDRKDSGDIGAGHAVTVLYEILPAGRSLAARRQPQSLKYQQVSEPQDPPTELTPVARTGEMLTLSLRYKEPDSDESTLREHVLNQKAKLFDAASSELRFAAAVAAFGMLLRDSDYRGTATFSKVEEIASSALGNDPRGHRTEFLDLVRITDTLK